MAIGINIESDEEDYGPISHWNEDLSESYELNFTFNKVDKKLEDMHEPIQTRFKEI